MPPCLHSRTPKACTTQAPLTPQIAAEHLPLFLLVLDGNPHTGSCFIYPISASQSLLDFPTPWLYLNNRIVPNLCYWLAHVSYRCVFRLAWMELDGLDGLPYMFGASAKLEEWLGWLGSFFSWSLILQELRLVLAFLIWQSRASAGWEGSTIMPRLFKTPLTSCLLMCPVPNKASVRANPESRGRKVD